MSNFLIINQVYIIYEHLCLHIKLYYIIIIHKYYHFSFLLFFVGFN
jgi:hypothetical protein